MPTSTELGRKAKAAAAEYLERQGCQVIDQNWRTRMCEIDIVAFRGEIIYFCEVKYRSKTAQGAGIEYVTPKKLRQMTFAAESWVHARKWQGAYQLCAIEVSEPNFTITNVVKDIL